MSTRFHLTVLRLRWLVSGACALAVAAVSEVARHGSLEAVLTIRNTRAYTVVDGLADLEHPVRVD